MSSKIDGVTRELLERVEHLLLDAFGGTQAGAELRALLAAPVVERQPLGYVHQWEIERIFAGNAHWATLWNSDGANNPSRNGSTAIAVYTAPPELAELQALNEDALAVNKTLSQQMDAMQATIDQQAVEIERLNKELNK